MKLINYQNNNYHVAWKHFYPEGNGEPKKGYVLHHIDTTLRHNDKERYLEWRIEDLAMMTKSEHMRLHSTGRHHSEEQKKKISEANKGRVVSEESRRKMSEHHVPLFGEKNPMYGKHHSEEIRKKMRDNHADVSGKKNPNFGKTGEQSAVYGMHWFNNGVISILSFECPEGFTRGRLKIA